MRQGYRFFVGLLLLLGAQAALARDYSGGFLVGTQAFAWREYDGGGNRLLKENGSRFTLGGFYGNLTAAPRGWIYRADGDIYFGSVDYDGQTQSGLPVKTDVYYSGVRVQGIGGYRFGIGGTQTFGIDLVGGLGLDYWKRNLKDSTTSSGTPVFGYDEFYSILYGKLAAGPHFQVGNWRSTLHAGLKLPMYTDEYIPNSRSGFDQSITLHPKGKLWGYVEFSNAFALRGNRTLRVDLYYDSYRFAKSDSTYATSGSILYLVHQPESHMDVIGLRAGLGF